MVHANLSGMKSRFLSILIVSLLFSGPLQARQARSLEYTVALTGNAQASDRLPMIVALHGLGNTPKGFTALFKRFKLPARVVLPQGPKPARNGGFSWFGIRLSDERLWVSEKDLRESAERIAALIGQLQERYPTRGKPIVVGFSQGGILAFVLAVEHPDSVGLAIPLSGWLPPEFWPKGPIADRIAAPIRAFHGESDAIIRLLPTRKSVEHLKSLGFDVQLFTYPGIKHTVTAAMKRRLYGLMEQAIKKK